MPAQQRSARTLDAIRAAAGRLVEKRSFAAVSVADIARLAGVGVGTFYHYYPSKEALLLDLRADLLATTRESLAAAFPTGGLDKRTFRKGLESLLRAWIAMAAKHRGLESAIAALSFESPELAKDVVAQERDVVELVATLIRAYATQLRPCVPETAAQAIVIFVEAVVVRTMRAPDTASDALVEEVARMIAHYLVPPPREHKKPST